MIQAPWSKPVHVCEWLLHRSLDSSASDISGPGCCYIPGTTSISQLHRNILHAPQSLDDGNKPSLDWSRQCLPELPIRILVYPSDRLRHSLHLHNATRSEQIRRLGSAQTLRRTDSALLTWMAVKLFRKLRRQLPNCPVLTG